MPPTVVNSPVYARQAETRTEHVPAHMWAWAATRIALGFVFLWAFLDKTFGLSYSTKPANSWLNGGSPTKGFLGGTKGTFQSFFHSIAGNVVTDWLFMLGLLFIGVALILGIGMRIAAVSGVLMMLLMWAAATIGVPSISNPIIDDHIVYAAVLIGLALVGAGKVLGLGKYWASMKLVQSQRYLE